MAQSSEPKFLFGPYPNWAGKKGYISGEGDFIPKRPGRQPWHTGATNRNRP